MKAQNLRILEALSKPKEYRRSKSRKHKAKKRKRVQVSSERERDSSDDSSRSPNHRHRTSGSFAKDHKTPDSGTDTQAAEIVIEDDDMILDQQIDNLLTSDEKVSEEMLTDDPLAEIQNEYEEEEETGPKVSEKLATVVKAMSTQKMTDEKLREKMDKHRRPENVEVHVPKVNPEIWALMDHNAKSADLKAQRAQKKLVKATFALTKVCEGFVMKPSTQNKDQLRDVTDAMSLILRISHDLSMERRTKILSSHNINKKYRRLASSDIKVTEYLFGDDLKSALLAIDATSKLEHSLTPANRGAKFVYRGAKNGDRDRLSFQGRGRGWSRGRMQMAIRGRGFPRTPRGGQQRHDRA